MKRIVITGLPCPPEAWQEFLGKHEGQRIIPIYEVLKNTSSSDPRVISRYVTEQISNEEPESIIAHDLGVPLTLLSLYRLSKRKPNYAPKVTLFNGVFRGHRLLRSPHLFKVQYTPYKRVVSEVERLGGHVDRRLLEYLPRIRSIYRHFIVRSMADALNEKLGLDRLLKLTESLSLKAQIQVIASENDPYIPWESLERLRSDFSVQNFYHLKYGHFPYSLDKNAVIPLVERFERAPTRLATGA